MSAARQAAGGASPAASGVIQTSPDVITSSVYSGVVSPNLVVDPATGGFGPAKYRSGEMVSVAGRMYIIGNDGIARQINASAGSEGLR